MEKSISELITDILYEKCCKGNKCRECEFSKSKCYLAVIINIIKNYERGEKR